MSQAADKLTLNTRSLGKTISLVVPTEGRALLRRIKEYSRFDAPGRKSEGDYWIKVNDTERCARVGYEADTMTMHVLDLSPLDDERWVSAYDVCARLRFSPLGDGRTLLVIESDEELWVWAQDIVGRVCQLWPGTSKEENADCLIKREGVASVMEVQREVTLCLDEYLETFVSWLSSKDAVRYRPVISTKAIYQAYDDTGLGDLRRVRTETGEPHQSYRQWVTQYGSEVSCGWGEIQYDLFRRKNDVIVTLRWTESTAGAVWDLLEKIAKRWPETRPTIKEWQVSDSGKEARRCALWEEWWQSDQVREIRRAAATAWEAKNGFDTIMEIGNKSRAWENLPPKKRREHEDAIEAWHALEFVPEEREESEESERHIHIKLTDTVTASTDVSGPVRTIISPNSMTPSQATKYAFEKVGKWEGYEVDQEKSKSGDFVTYIVSHDGEDIGYYVMMGGECIERSCHAKAGEDHDRVFQYVTQQIEQLTAEGVEAEQSDENDEDGDQNQDNPWDLVPDHLWDRMAVELWCNGYQGGEIAQRVSVAPGTVHNRISELRKLYPDAGIPFDEDRRQRMIDSIGKDMK